MSSQSPNLTLPLLEPAQAQKHITHNEALELLDALVQLVAIDRTRRAPPPDAKLGDRHIVATGPTGEWAGQENKIALRGEETWRFIDPRQGWTAQILAENATALWDGTAWRTPLSEEVRTARIGVGATPDDYNRIAIGSAASLFSHAGAGHQLKINKAAPEQTASLLFQTAHSGRAEMGIVGNDDFTFKVSGNGSTFTTAMTVNRTNGQTTFPHGLVANGPITGPAVQANQTDATIDRLMRVGAFGLGDLAPRIANASVVDNSIAPGIYHMDVPRGSSGGPANVAYGSLIHTRRSTFGGETQLVVAQSPVDVAGQLYTRARAAAEWSPWRKVWDSLTTTVDSNGFIKQASPIVRLFDDRIEEPVEPTGARLVRHGKGEYALEGTLGLAQQGWQIEVPRDHNGNIVVHVTTEWHDGTLTIRTSVPEWSNGRMQAGAPVAITAGRWIDIRLHEEAAPVEGAQP